MIKWKQLMNKDTPSEWQTELLKARAFTQFGSIGRNFGDTCLLWHVHLQLLGGGGWGGWGLGLKFLKRSAGSVLKF